MKTGLTEVVIRQYAPQSGRNKALGYAWLPDVGKD